METSNMFLLSVVGVVFFAGAGYLAGKIDERTKWNELIKNGHLPAPRANRTRNYIR